MSRFTPEVGAWYQDLQTGIVFEVVAVDDAAQTIETQCREGEISEYDFDSWRETQLILAEEPEDWRDAFELAREDSSDPDQPLHPEDWSGPLNQIEPEYINGLVDDLDT